MQHLVFHDPWDYQLLDTGAGFRLEQWGKFRLRRPDPTALWQSKLPDSEWHNADAWFEGAWFSRPGFPKTWDIRWHDLLLVAKLSPFKHTGIFPEQSAHWEWLRSSLPKSGEGQRERLSANNLKPNAYSLKVLNLFAYTGATTILLAKMGCEVTHVDASKPSIAWAKDNQKANGLAEDSVRWILDDAAKFVSREIKRGVKYDGIILDPPAFGHSPSGKTWKFEKDFTPLLKNVCELLSPSAKFLIVNSYGAGVPPVSLANVAQDFLKNKGDLEFGELCLQDKSKRLLSTGSYLRWSH